MNKIKEVGDSDSFHNQKAYFRYQSLRGYHNKSFTHYLVAEDTVGLCLPRIQNPQIPAFVGAPEQQGRSIWTPLKEFTRKFCGSQNEHEKFKMSLPVFQQNQKWHLYPFKRYSKAREAVEKAPNLTGTMLASAVSLICEGSWNGIPHR